MKFLEEKIIGEGRVLEGDILKVDMFLNHQIDPVLIDQMGIDFKDHFIGKNITKVLTLEVSGIAIAYSAAFHLGVPLVFAKKIESKSLSSDVYKAEVVSYTKGKTFEIRVDKKYLTKDDNILIIDDFLAKGQALHGLVDLCDQAGASIAGIAIAIEKTFQEGGKHFRDLGYDVYSQAQIKEFKDGKVIFE